MWAPCKVSRFGDFLGVFLEKGMCQEDNKPGQAIIGWVIHTEEGRIQCQARSDPRHDPKIDEGYAFNL